MPDRAETPHESLDMPKTPMFVSACPNTPTHSDDLPETPALLCETPQTPAGVPPSELLDAPPPAAYDLVSAASGMVLLITGAVYFRAAEHRFADRI